jgi:uncharacterized damage-inducible protein DinB
MASPKQAFLDAYDREHATTLRVLRAYPADQADLRPHPRCRSAREIAWTFVLERALGTKVLNNEFAAAPPARSAPPSPPADWSALIAAYEKAHADYGALIRGWSDAELQQTVKFFTAPKTMGEWRRLDFAWLLLCDEIHHRGQLSVYLRAAGGKVPSIYGPSGDEPWM